MLWHPDQDAEISIIPKRSFYAPRPSRQPPRDDCHHGLVPGCRICAVVCISLESGFFRSTHFFFFFSDSHHVAVCLLGKWGPFAWTCCRLSVSLPMGILVVSRFRLCWTTLPGTSPPQSFSEQRFPFPLGEDLGGKLVWSQRRRVWNVFKNCRTAAAPRATCQWTVRTLRVFLTRAVLLRVGCSLAVGFTCDSVPSDQRF